MCHLAIAEIAASLEMSCVTIAFRLPRESVCKPSCANSLGLPLVLLVQPQGFGKPAESPSWCSAAGQPNCSLPTKRHLLTGPGTVSISVTHLWPLVAVGWLRLSARDAAGVWTPIFQSCVVAPLLPKGASHSPFSCSPFSFSSHLPVAAITSADKLLCVL